MIQNIIHPTTEQSTLTDLLEMIEFHRNEQARLVEQVQEHLPEGFVLVQTSVEPPK